MPLPELAATQAHHALNALLGLAPHPQLPGLGDAAAAGNCDNLRVDRTIALGTATTNAITAGTIATADAAVRAIATEVEQLRPAREPMPRRRENREENYR